MVIYFEAADIKGIRAPLRIQAIFLFLAFILGEGPKINRLKSYSTVAPSLIYLPLFLFLSFLYSFIVRIS